MLCQAQFIFEEGWKFPLPHQGRFLFRDAVVEQPELLLPLTLKEAEIFIDTEGRHRFRGRGAWGLSSFDTNGLFEVGEDGLRLQRADVSGRMDVMEILLSLYRGFE